ncbi:hypothetical protein LUW77_02505 [Streptomyces radiopugnans]|nr:hypothetical protein LUW77_02505 [Streptomyces radiopugnans]
MTTTGAGGHMDGTADRTGTAEGPAPAAAMRAVLARLDAHAARARGDGAGVGAPGTTGAPGPAEPADPPESAALEALVRCFGLTPFEREIVLLLAAAELEPTTGSRCAAASGDPERAHPTFSLALAALGEPHWSALTPVAPLRRWRLVELDDETRLTTTRIRLDERILHFLLGSPYLDARLHGMLTRAAAPDRLPPSFERAAERVAEVWAGARPRYAAEGGTHRRRPAQPPRHRRGRRPQLRTRPLHPERRGPAHRPRRTRPARPAVAARGDPAARRPAAGGRRNGPRTGRGSRRVHRLRRRTARRLQPRPEADGADARRARHGA